MSVYDLYQSYLNQQQVSPVMQSPVTDPNYLLYLQQLQQQQGGGGDDRFTNVVDTTNNAGIYSIQDVFEKFKNIPTPLNLARMGIEGIGNLINNIQNPYTTFTGALKRDVREAIDRDLARDVQGAGIGFGGDTTGQRAGGGGFGGNTAGGFSESDPSAIEGSF